MVKLLDKYLDSSEGSGDDYMQREELPQVAVQVLSESKVLFRSLYKLESCRT